MRTGRSCSAEDRCGRLPQEEAWKQDHHLTQRRNVPSGLVGQKAWPGACCVQLGRQSQGI